MIYLRLWRTSIIHPSSRRSSRSSLQRLVGEAHLSHRQEPWRKCNKVTTAAVREAATMVAVPVALLLISRYLVLAWDIQLDFLCLVWGANIVHDHPRLRDPEAGMVPCEKGQDPHRVATVKTVGIGTGIADTAIAIMTAITISIDTVMVVVDHRPLIAIVRCVNPNRSDAALRMAKATTLMGDLVLITVITEITEIEGIVITTETVSVIAIVVVTLIETVTKPDTALGPLARPTEASMVPASMTTSTGPMRAVGTAPLERASREAIVIIGKTSLHHRHRHRR
jgi:hypothetical protein